MEPTTMIIVTIALSCTGSEGLCRVFVDPAGSRGLPALSSGRFAPVPDAMSRTMNALRPAGEGAQARAPRR